MPELFINRKVRVFKAGKYPDKKVEFTEEDISNLETNFISPVPIKIEHVKTPFDGFLGTLTKVWKEGLELFGNIALPPYCNTLIEEADAKKVSVGISKDKKHILELSIVKSPRVDDATIFNGEECFVFNEEENIEFATLSVDDVAYRVERALSKNGTYGYVYKIYTEPSFLIISHYGIYYKYDFTLDGENITLSNKRPAVMSWDDSDTDATTVIEEIPAVSNDFKVETVTNTTDEGSQQMADTNVVSQEELKKAQDDLIQFKQRTYIKEANDFLNIQLSAGKITPASLDFAREILVKGEEVPFTFNNEAVSISDMFRKFIDVQPKVVEFSETVVNTKTDVTKKTDDLEGTNLDEEKVQFLMSKFPGLTREDIIEQNKNVVEDKVVFSTEDED